VTDFTLPELGENIAAGDVVRVLVHVGETIARDQPVIELETDKATVEVPSSVAGTVTDIKVKAGDTVQVGAVVLTVDGDGRVSPEPAGAQAVKTRGTETGSAPPSREPRESAGGGVPSPSLGLGGPTATNPAGPFDPEPSAPVAPVSGKVVSMPRASRTPEPDPVPAGAASADRGPAAPASPAVRRVAREIGVDIDEVEGSGPSGRISQDDVKAHARRILTSVGSGRSSAQPAVRPLPDFSTWGAIERRPMSSIRRATAEHLTSAWRTIPHVTQVDKADITQIERLRKEFAPRVEEQGGKLTMTAILIKVLAAAVEQFPQFNASIDVEAAQVIYKRYVNVGVAVDTERGLLVPVIRHADQKGLTQIAVEIQQAAVKARDRKLSIDDMSGAGISLSNLGGIGGAHFTPIINWPEVAILGVSRAALEPVYQQDGSVAPRLLLPLSLSYDHRLIDGADGMRFLRWIVSALEQPFLLAL
jgi:pyruvate dehydrogenase E2 component (dihydrolipoamide acetyltransferase)